MSNIFKYVIFRQLHYQELQILSSVSRRNPNGIIFEIQIRERKASLWPSTITRTFISPADKDGKKLTRFERSRKTFREYWYVAIPIHMISSTIWFGGCYYASEHGFNILKVLQKLGVKEDIIDFLRHSSMGQLTVAFALFKLLTPVRVLTTFLSSTFAISYLSRAGLIQPARNPFTRKKRN